MKYIVKCSLFGLLSIMSITAFSATPKLANMGKSSAEYLDEKSAFCYSQDALGQYLNAARASDIDSMNQLVFDGHCNFVPDGQVYSLRDYKNENIGVTPVVAFNKNDKTLWTFKVFVHKVEFNGLN